MVSGDIEPPSGDREAEQGDDGHDHVVDARRVERPGQADEPGEHERSDPTHDGDAHVVGDGDARSSSARCRSTSGPSLRVDATLRSFVVAFGRRRRWSPGARARGADHAPAWQPEPMATARKGVLKDVLVWKVGGLCEHDLRLPRTPTGTNLLGLVKHALNTEVTYFGAAFGREWATPDELVPPPRPTSKPAGMPRRTRRLQGSSSSTDEYRPSRTRRSSPCPWTRLVASRTGVTRRSPSTTS